MMMLKLTMNSCYILLLLSLHSSLSCANPLQTSNTSDECPRGCPRILSPLCATDGANNFQYFHNECLMRLDGCRSGTGWSEARMSLCMPHVEPLVRAECMRPCPFIYDPICASNGQSYEAFGNECIFRIENCLDNGKWIMAKKSECGF